MSTITLTSVTDDFRNQICAVLTDPEYVKKHLRLYVQRRDTKQKDELKRHVLNLDLVMKVGIDFMESNDTTSNVVVSSNLLGLSGLSEDEAWEVAEQNTASESIVGSMSNILFGSDDMPSMFFIATTKNKDGRLSYSNGGALLAIKKTFRDFCRNLGVDACAILPSSTQELLLIPENDDMPATYHDLANLVRDVNASGVTDPRIALDPVAYRYDLNTDSIEIAATAI